MQKKDRLQRVAGLVWLWAVVALLVVAVAAAAWLAPLWQAGYAPQEAQALFVPGADRINLNEATAEELAVLPGIGQSKAEAIVAYRLENGLFLEVGQLTDVPGIGEKTLEKFKEWVCV